MLVDDDEWEERPKKLVASQEDNLHARVRVEQENSEDIEHEDVQIVIVIRVIRYHRYRDLVDTLDVDDIIRQLSPLVNTKVDEDGKYDETHAHVLGRRL